MSAEKSEARGARGGTLGLIAGGGDFPRAAAKEARRRGYRVVVSLIEETRARFPKGVAQVVECVSLARAGDTLELFRREGVRDVLMVGKVDKRLNFTGHDFDATALSMLSRMAGRADMQIAKAVIEELESRGFRVRKQSDFLKDHLVKEGLLCGELDAGMQKDIDKGLRIARDLAAHDIGQTLVLREGAVIAVEAFEHTDATVRRAGRMVGGNLVVVKVARPSQDARFDLPAVGPETIRTMAKAKAKVLAVQAHLTLMADPEVFIEAAEKAGITVVGVVFD